MRRRFVIVNPSVTAAMWLAEQAAGVKPWPRFRLFRWLP